MQTYTLTNDMKIICSYCVNIHTDINKTYKAIDCNDVQSMADPCMS